MNKLMIAALIAALPLAAQAGISCKAFDDQAAAQAYYAAQKPGYKILDKDKDGEACECLPGGSKYGESVCRAWRKKNGK